MSGLSCSKPIVYVLMTFHCGLYVVYRVQHFNEFHSCYDKCMKAVFGYSKFSSVTGLLLDLKLPSFNTIVHDACLSFRNHFINCR